jgi:hypothetical protein
MLTQEEQQYAIRTWRYIRIAMVALVAMLAVAIVYEHFKAHCYLQSLSASYYTPVHSIFVVTEVGIGLCLMCVKASNQWEEVALNIAGGTAPLIGFVPKPTVDGCASHLEGVADRTANIGNNVIAYLVITGLALAILLVHRIFWVRRQGLGLAKPGTIGYLIAVAAWTVALVGYLASTTTFDHDAHYIASGVTALGMVVVIGINAFETKITGIYGRLALAALVALVVMFVAKLAGWQYWLLGLETSLAVAFAAFWLIQTHELWDQGVRRRPAASP